MSDKVTFSDHDRRHMRRALELALRGLYSTDPNPRVGCVLVSDGKTVGEGWHERAGEAHAEVHALRAAGEAARAATAYVTLEPCAGHGRTPPCVQALLAAGVARVVFAAADPNPRMQGGAALLRAGGVQVDAGLLADEAHQLNPGFFQRLERGMPWVRVKVGASLDGRTALANGASRWITNEASREDVQTWRARSSAILTGIGTVLADDPTLNVRLPAASRQPLRVVLDSALRIPAEAKILNVEGSSLIFVAADTHRDLSAQADYAQRAATLQARGAKILGVAQQTVGRLDLRMMLARLAELAVNEVWVEAGARLTGAFIAAGLVDELIVYLAPTLLGPDARPLAELPSIADLAQRRSFRLGGIERFGDDLRLQYLRESSANPSGAMGSLEG